MFNFQGNKNKNKKKQQQQDHTSSNPYTLLLLKYVHKQIKHRRNRKRYKNSINRERKR